VEMQFTGKYNGFGRVLPQSNTKERSRTFLHYHAQLQTLVRQSPSGLRSKAQSNHTYLPNSPFCLIVPTGDKEAFKKAHPKCNCWF